VQKPEKLYKEKGLILYILLMVSVFVAFLFIDIPALSVLLDKSLLPVGW